jgi:indolepyruvate ferredoxin oxidoreductase
VDAAGLQGTGEAKIPARTAFDPFGYTAERKVERRLIGEYEALIGEL